MRYKFGCIMFCTHILSRTRGFTWLQFRGWSLLDSLTTELQKTCGQLRAINWFMLKTVLPCEFKMCFNRAVIKFWVTEVKRVLVFTPITNLLLCEWIVSTTSKFTHNMKGLSSMHSGNRSCRLHLVGSTTMCPLECCLLAVTTDP